MLARKSLVMIVARVMMLTIAKCDCDRADTNSKVTELSSVSANIGSPPMVIIIIIIVFVVSTQTEH